LGNFLVKITIFIFSKHVFVIGFVVFIALSFGLSLLFGTSFWGKNRVLVVLLLIDLFCS